MIVFWRDTPLSGHEYALTDAVEVAHRKSAIRGNASTVALKAAAGGSGSFEMALASALLTLGGKHAPIAKIYRMLDQPLPQLLEAVETKICEKEIVQGWGNSFFKNRHDPDWEPVQEALAHVPEMNKKIVGVTALLHDYDKHVFPNAGAYTAATAIILGIPPEVASVLLISARLPVWAHLASKEL